MAWGEEVVWDLEEGAEKGERVEGVSVMEEKDEEA